MNLGPFTRLLHSPNILPMISISSPLKKTYLLLPLCGSLGSPLLPKLSKLIVMLVSCAMEPWQVLVVLSWIAVVLRFVAVLVVAMSQLSSIWSIFPFGEAYFLLGIVVIEMLSVRLTTLRPSSSFNGMMSLLPVIMLLSS
ncbi:hypothetical protein PIB30_088744 [Stylosanthes scabra]|uniref:Uncharacterized protein n=1 Tax=Stylosanthes scabra TaxID=79078 RepID=A0ABU6VTG7_9FABA|nr:hypothetical protein [Stylosanthes scabra]